MRGEFIGVWTETWREIWNPLIDQEGVPDDIFSELYREVTVALKEPSADDAADLVISDAIQLREAFEHALVLAGIEIDLTRCNEVFDGSGAVSLDSPVHRRATLETALAMLIGDPTRVKETLTGAISELVEKPEKRAEVLERARESIINNPLRSREAFELTRSNDFAGERALITFLEHAYGICDDLGGDPLSNLYFNLLDTFIAKFSLRYDLRRPCTLCPTLPGIFASLVRELNGLGRVDRNVSKRLKDFQEAFQDFGTCQRL